MRAIQIDVLTCGDPIIRSIFPEEQGKVLSQCLSEAGWPGASADVEGGLKFPTSPEAQKLAFNTTPYECETKYSIDPQMLLGAPEEPMREVQWYYLRDYAIPCLIAHGEQPQGELPSKESYIASGGAYSPFRLGPPPRPDALRKACPQEAEDPNRQYLGLARPQRGEGGAYPCSGPTPTFDSVDVLLQVSA